MEPKLETSQRSQRASAVKRYDVRTQSSTSGAQIRTKTGTPSRMKGVRVFARVQICTDDRERFRSLVGKWRKATARYSNLAKVVDDPSSQAVMEFPNAVKYMVDELRREPSRLVYLLRRMVGTNPYQGEPGDIAGMAQAWVAWFSKDSMSRRSKRGGVRRRGTVGAP